MWAPQSKITGFLCSPFLMLLRVLTLGSFILQRGRQNMAVRCSRCSFGYKKWVPKFFLPFWDPPGRPAFYYFIYVFRRKLSFLRGTLLILSHFYAKNGFSWEFPRFSCTTFDSGQSGTMFSWSMDLTIFWIFLNEISHSLKSGFLTSQNQK